MIPKAVDRIRNFNRFYTNLIGVLDRTILESPFSLSEARVLYELNHVDACTARDIMRRLTMDEGYLSRILDRFIREGLIKKIRSDSDGRAFLLSVTTKGRSHFLKINTASAEGIQKIISHLSEKQLEDLIFMMDQVQRLLTYPNEKANT
jgi:DNA-binding MarR family transcriptional regulator